jgi:hypothetical protein
MCLPFTHDYRVVDMTPGIKRHRDRETGEIVNTEISAVLYQCSRCGWMRSDGLLGRFKLERVKEAQESRELARLVKL